jgi:PPE-repeat protein
MDFGLLPPEITSALIHSGPGAHSLIEASGVWRQLGVELEESVSGYTSVLSSMTEGWRGPSAAAMAEAVEPYLAWLRTTAQQCEQLFASAQAVAAAFNSTFTAVVPPAFVSANRVRLAQLLATNWFGSNLAAIAATEDEYVGVWANNSAAMFRYQVAATQALALPQFSSPPAIANPAAAAAQASSVPAAAAATPAQSALGDLLTSLLSTPGGFNPQKGWFGLAALYGNQFIAGGIPINLLGYLAQLSQAQTLQSVGSQIGQGLSQGSAALGGAAADLAGAIRGVGSGSAPTAALGVGVSMGKLIMPPAVVGLLAASQSPVQLASAVSPLPVGEFGLPSIPMPPFMMPPRAATRKRRREGRDYDDIEYGLELKGTFMPRPPSAG